MRDFSTKRIKRCQGSPTVKLMDQGKELQRNGQDVLLFTIGEPDFNSPEEVKTAGVQAIERNLTRYTPSAGIPELREMIGRKLKEENGIRVDPAREIIVTPSAKLAFFHAAMAFLEEGDEVMALEPTWMTYRDVVALSGANYVSVPLSIEENFRVTEKKLEKYVTNRTKMLVFCNPNNPTGHVMDWEEIQTLAAFAEKHDLLVVADEIYEKILYEGETHYSIGAIPEVRDRVITINGYSKSYAMMGWRLGYSAANVRLTSEMMKMQQNTVTTASSISQYAAMASYRCQGNVANMVEEYEKRRNYLFDALQKIPCVTCYKPAGTFYMFFRIDYQGMNSFELAEYMLDRANVLVVLGEVYGIGGEKCIRFSFAAPMRDIEKAVARIQRIFQ